ncbi:MAG: multiheme c-type cytochrome [Pirellulales bacterium]
MKNGTPPRDHDPECISCHVTGWDPQRYYPYTTGFLNETDTPNMVGNGCENCHGPGKKHADAESQANRVDAKLLTALRNEMKAPRDASGCMTCHDVDNSPDFSFEKYWPQIEHKGKN